MNDKKALGVILAGGRGTRLRHLGEVLPKCLLPVFDQPLLLRQIEQCARAGVEEVLVSIAETFAPLVTAVLGRFDSPVKVTCVPEAVPLGPVGGLVALLRGLGNRRVLTLLGDEYFQDLDALQGVTQALVGGAADLALGVVLESRPSQIFCNAVLDAEGHVRALREKPAPEEIIGDVRWCGVAAFPADAFLQTAGCEPRLDTQMGDALGSLIDRGYVAQAVAISEVHLNLNTLDAALVASIVECSSGQVATLEGILTHLRDLMGRTLPHLRRDGPR